MQKILFSRINKVIVIIIISLMPFATTAQTVPNLYPAKCIARFIKDHIDINLFAADTTKKQIKKPLNLKIATSGLKKSKSDSIFINHDKEVKDRILKIWKH